LCFVQFGLFNSSSPLTKRVVDILLDFRAPSAALRYEALFDRHYFYCLAAPSVAHPATPYGGLFNSWPIRALPALVTMRCALRELTGRCTWRSTQTLNRVPCAFQGHHGDNPPGNTWAHVAAVAQRAVQSGRN
jgi:hypothetical protein